MKKLFALMISVMLLCSIAGCGKQAVLPVSDDLSAGESGAPEASMTTTTAVLAVTRADGTVETAADGSIVTTVVSALPTVMQTVTDAKGQAVTKADGTAVTEAVIPPVVAVGTDPGGKLTTSAIQSRRVTTTTTRTGASLPTGTNGSTSGGKSDGSTVAQELGTMTINKPTTTTKKPDTTKQLTTTKKPTTSTTKKPTTTTTKAPTASDDIWGYPYNVEALIKYMRNRVERNSNLKWDDRIIGGYDGILHKDWFALPNGISADMVDEVWDLYDFIPGSWDNPSNTVACTEEKDKEFFKWMIDDFCDANMQYFSEHGHMYFRIYWEPYQGHPGDYLIYWFY